MNIAQTFEAPYYAVIFTSFLNPDTIGYSDMAEKMENLAQTQEGFLGMESVRDGLGITISYWESLEAIKNWKMNLAHQEAQHKGKAEWYKKYKVRICKVTRDYDFEI